MAERKVLTLKEAKKCYLCYLCKERSAIFLVQTFLGSNQAIVKKRLITCLVFIGIQLFYV